MKLSPLLLLVALLSCAPLQGTPRLVVVIVVDQMRADYLDRFDAHYEHGLRRLIDEGLRYDNAHVGHALTGTASGHTTIATGRDPSEHGVIEKRWYDADRDLLVDFSLDALEQGIPATTRRAHSPRKILSTGLGDWLKRGSPRSRAYSISLKARSAVALGGQRADAAIWFDEPSARFVSSSYYVESAPQWLLDFDQDGSVARCGDHPWDLLKPAGDYEDSREDAFAFEGDRENTQFPHAMPSFAVENHGDFSFALCRTPFADRLVLDLAARVVVAEELGTDNSSDLLFVSCSAADYIGHMYGPYSRETQDYYLRLDGYLGEFLSTLDANVGAEHYQVVLTSDHGVAQLPEASVRSGLDARRVVDAEFQAILASVGDSLATRWDTDASPFAHVSAEGIWLRSSDVERRNEAIAALENLELIERAYARDELLSGEDTTDSYAAAYARSAHPLRSPDILLRYPENWVVATYPGGTDHSGPYAYDSKIPLLLWGSGFPARRVNARVELRQIAPTLAAVLQCEVPASLRSMALPRSD